MQAKLPFLPAGVGRARGRRVCGMSVGPRVSPCVCFLTELKKFKQKKQHWRPLGAVGCCCIYPARCQS